jgi:uncharacterized protein YbjT (DUF2867 family)
VGRVSVLGATGVVGRTLVSELAETHDVVAVSREPDDAVKFRRLATFVRITQG